MYLRGRQHGKSSSPLLLFLPVPPLPPCSSSTALLSAPTSTSPRTDTDPLWQAIIPKGGKHRFPPFSPRQTCQVRARQVKFGWLMTYKLIGSESRCWWLPGMVTSLALLCCVCRVCCVASCVLCVLCCVVCVVCLVCVVCVGCVVCVVCCVCCVWCMRCVCWVCCVSCVRCVCRALCVLGVWCVSCVVCVALHRCDLPTPEGSSCFLHQINWLLQVDVEPSCDMLVSLHKCLSVEPLGINI